MKTTKEKHAHLKQEHTEEKERHVQSLFALQQANSEIKALKEEVGRQQRTISDLETDVSRISSQLSKEETNHVNALKRLDDQVNVYQREKASHAETAKSLEDQLAARKKLAVELGKKAAQFNTLSKEMEQVKREGNRFKKLAADSRFLAEENVVLKKRLKDKAKQSDQQGGEYFWSNFFCLPLLPGL